MSWHRRDQPRCPAGGGVTVKTRSWWGWGWTQDAIPDAECAALGALLPGLAAGPVPVPEIPSLPEVRVAPPAALAPLVSASPADLAAHAMGKAYRDVVRALYGDHGRVPDLVAHPAREQDVVDLLDWAGETRTAVIPYGGGSSVVGGVEYRGDDHAAVLSLDLTRLDRVLEVDPAGRAARIQAGVLGPRLEDQLRPYGLTLRHFPQSFEFSTLGGWLATRSGGHYATLHTHIDDFVESIRAVTPRGIWESRRLPGSGAGPSPDRMLLGSEGILGVITEAWMRLQDRPTFRASATARFPTFATAVDATRAISQTGLHPANCRLIDATEAMITGAGDGSAHLLLLGFESADHPLDAW